MNIDILGKIFSITASALNLSDEVKGLNREVVAEALRNLADGNWGAVSRMFSEGNDLQVNRGWGNVIIANYQIAGVELEVYASIGREQITRPLILDRVTILTRGEGKRLSEALMGGLMAMKA